MMKKNNLGKYKYKIPEEKYQLLSGHGLWKSTLIKNLVSTYKSHQREKYA